MFSLGKLSQFTQTESILSFVPPLYIYLFIFFLALITFWSPVSFTCLSVSEPYEFFLFLIPRNRAQCILNSQPWSFSLVLTWGYVFIGLRGKGVRKRNMDVRRSGHTPRLQVWWGSYRRQPGAQCFSFRPMCLSFSLPSSLKLIKR